jgi:hypothetical protein
MYARAIDEAGDRLRALRHEAWGDLGLAALAFGLGVAATRTRSELAAPLLVGALALVALGARAAWRRWELIERLAGQVDAYAIADVLAYASRQGTMERRQSFAALIRCQLPQPGLDGDERILAVADELEALAAELDDGALALDPASAVACMRLLSDLEESPLLNRARPTEELRSRIRQIRSGFKPRRLAT